MSEINTVIIRFMTAKLLTLYHSLQVILFLLVTWLKNPFRNPWSVKLKLEPPARLTDPKYGTHKYLKANNIKLHYVESGDPTKPLMCIAIDMRGYGDSEKPEGIEHYKLNTLAADLRDLVRQLGALTPPINYYRANFGYSSELKPQDQQPVPFLFAHGSNEKYLNAKIRENIKTLYQHVEIAIIEDSGHFTQQEDPEKVNKLIRDFLAKQNL
ncbi:unnamed protein product [Leptidea sinapis]|uniref:AB hydrolase-1 domain-containing protein n=1 Tax=Leptidea sinapis TaxID=189913 RepID=A0A5E4Q2H4_9NEOP|nr:unnamed protein product [Leptidea sinapis]